MGLLLLAVAGAADSFSAVCRNTIMQTLTPDELRGRLTATYFMVVVGGPFIGDLEAGVVAGVTRRASRSCPAACSASSAWSRPRSRFPQVWRYRGRATDVPPALTDDAVAGPPV